MLIYKRIWIVPPLDDIITTLFQLVGVKQKQAEGRVEE